MVILHSCCCWNSVRKGSIACAIYTGIYYTLNAAQSSVVFHEQYKFLRNNKSISESPIDHDITNETSTILTALVFAFSSCGIFTSLLLFLGIHKNIKYLLIPWIFNMVFFIIVDVIYVVNGLVMHALKWNPSVAILVTIDFFLNALNLYALLCVLSQYQEYRAGRGRATDQEALHRIPNIQYSITQPTATSYLSSHARKPMLYFDKVGTTTAQATPTHSPTGYGQSLLVGVAKKTVKFGDSSEMVMLPSPVQQPPWTESHKSNEVTDRAPLIDSSCGGVDGGNSGSVRGNTIGT
ncbi:hypothetical protein ABEB36_001719 [Hypothenemus hampei]|uniref:Lysosomal-associated transmembrane protein 4B n=1 Tax=Hypothenemus hampei TaxID=57062 RepID=A0ABD1FHD4_HYPHA